MHALHGDLQRTLLCCQATTHLLGYAHVQFETPDSVAKAIQTCDKHELHGRVMRVTKQAQCLSSCIYGRFLF